jgi:tripartite-type tricarboxylate transporter receptor subunit TctC
MSNDLSRRKWLIASVGTGMAGMSFAQEYPAKPIRIVVPQAAGGGTDILARHLAARMTDLYKQGVVVENRTGAGSLLGTEHVARASADGYTLMMGGLFNMVMNKALIKNLSYSPENDFISLGYVSAYPFVLLMRPDLPFSSLAELVAYGKTMPGKLTYGSGGLGTLQHVWGAILAGSLNLDMVHVPFKGAAPAHQEMMAGRLDVMFDNLSAAKPHIQSGRLKALAVSSAQRSAALPMVPTVNETGLTRFEGESWFGVFAPVNTPSQVVNRLRETLALINRENEFVSRVHADGGRMLNVPAGQQQSFLRDEIERWVGAVQRFKVMAD